MHFTLKSVATPSFGKIFGGHVRTVPGNRCSNLKSVALTVLELLAFNAQKFKGSRDPGHAPFWKNFWDSCPNSELSLETCVKFEVRTFNRFEAICI